MNKIKATQIIEDIQGAIDSVLKKHGVAMDGHTGRFDDTRLKVSFELVDVGRDCEDVEKSKFASSCHLLGLQAEDYGKPFTWQGRKFVISGISPRAKKYPLLGRDVKSGQTYKFPMRAYITSQAA